MNTKPFFPSFIPCHARKRSLNSGRASDGLSLKLSSKIAAAWMIRSPKARRQLSNVATVPTMTKASTPAIARARVQFSAEMTISGPAVPDAVFRSASMGDADAVVAMYHDQGLIPLKLIDFDEAVNVTLGLPIVRTSPDHGVAYDLAGRGTARATSFFAALRLADAMVGR